MRKKMISIFMNNHSRIREIIRSLIKETQIPGASPHELEDTILGYAKIDPDWWHNDISDAFEEMADGDSADGFRIRFPVHWEDEDFEYVLKKINKILD